ncbi:hypothetical protein MOQ_001305 [Trypanosoma cruzi marinkellei]|uniref:EF-hand domain-containing protein n=1 Tax=Trypanosoma cruzi marinkellei TaxID=85056 RepID=K2NGJ5_TRYCR|nr:hypothetical protein MOQ_001305 [Trypanosoma cruzi marinkellei]
MSFYLLACTDIRGEKVNVELPFREPPPVLAELYRTLEYVFRGEENDFITKQVEKSTRPSEPFTVSRVQRYEADTQAWVELTDVRQLRVHDQLYVFRKHATKADISTRRDIPAPRSSLYFSGLRSLDVAKLDAEHGMGPNHTENKSPSTPTIPYLVQQPGASFGTRSDNRRTTNDFSNPTPVYHANSSGGVASNGALVPATEHGRNVYSGLTEGITPEQVDVVFAVGDSNQRGYLTVRDLQGIFHACQIQFPMDVVEELHCFFAKEKRGEAVMTHQDFHDFAREFVQTVSVAYLRLGIHERQKVIEQEQRENAAAVDELQVQKKVLEERLEAVQRQLTKEQEKKARLRNELGELERANDPDYREQEQRLLNKEFSVFQYRQKLHQEENDYEQLAAERRRRAPSMALGNLPTQNGGYSCRPRE